MNLVWFVAAVLASSPDDGDLWDGSAPQASYLDNRFNRPTFRQKDCTDKRSVSDIPLRRAPRRSFKPIYYPPLPRMPQVKAPPSKPTCIESACVTKVLNALGVPADLIKDLNAEACDRVVANIKPTPAIQQAIRDAVNAAKREGIADQLESLNPNPKQPLDPAVAKRLSELTPKEMEQVKALLKDPEVGKCTSASPWCWALVKDIVLKPLRYQNSNVGVNEDALIAFSKADLAIDATLQQAAQAVGPPHDLAGCIEKFKWCRLRSAQFFADLQ